MDSTIISQLMGKQFLLDEANFIGAFNPHNTSTYDNTIEATVSTTSTIYILPLSHFQEPTETEFMNISKLTDFASFIDLNTTAVNDLIQNQQKKAFAKSAVATPANISIALNQGVRTISLSNVINFTPYSIGFEALSTDQIDFNIFNDAFAIIKIQETKTNKTYTDLPGAEQLILIPASVLAAKKLLTVPEYASTVTNYPVGTTLLDTTFTEPFQLDKAQSEGVQFVTKDSTGKEVKCYMTGGYTMTNSATPTTYTADDSIYVSEVLNDGTLAGFTEIGIHPFGKLTSCGVHVTSKCVYIFGGRSGVSSAPVMSASIYKANINADGTIGAFSIIGTLPVAQCRLEYRVGNENFIYIVGGYSTTTLSVLYTYKINEDTSLTLLATTPMTFNSYSSGLYFRDTPEVKELYTFGGYFAEAGGHQKIMRIPLDLVTGLPGTPIEVGSIAGGTTGYSAVSPVSDSDNIYLLGGWVNTLYYTKDVRKISLATLFAATDASKCTMILDSWQLPFNIKYTNGGSGVETSRYLYFMCFDIAANSTTSISPSTSSTRVFKFKKSARVSDLKIQTLNASFSTGNKELLKNKLYQRYYLEHLSNLVEKKRNQTSFTYNNIDISFKDPLTGTILNVQAPTNTSYRFYESHMKFIKWLNTILAKSYSLVEGYKPLLNPTIVYGLDNIINLDVNYPELLWNVLFDSRFYNINLSALNYYVATDPIDFDLSQVLKDLPTLGLTNFSWSLNYTPNNNLNVNKSRYILDKRYNEKISYIFTPVIKNYSKSKINTIMNPLWTSVLTGQNCVYKQKDGIDIDNLNYVKYAPNGTIQNTDTLYNFEYVRTGSVDSGYQVYISSMYLTIHINGIETNLLRHLETMSWELISGTTTGNLRFKNGGTQYLDIIFRDNSSSLTAFNRTTGKFNDTWNGLDYFKIENTNNVPIIERISPWYPQRSFDHTWSIIDLSTNEGVRYTHSGNIDNSPQYNWCAWIGLRSSAVNIQNVSVNFWNQVFAQLPYCAIPLNDIGDETIPNYESLERINIFDKINFDIK